MLQAWAHILCEEMETFKQNCAEIRKPVKLFESLAHNNGYTSFPSLFIALRFTWPFPWPWQQEK